MHQNKEPKRATVVYGYLGQDSHGYLRLHDSGEELLVEGELYAVSRPSKKPPTGLRKMALVKLRASPNFVRESGQDSTFPVCTETGERLRVIGRIVNVARFPLEIKKHSVILSAPVVREEQKPTIAPPNSPGRKPAKEQQLDRELKRVTALIEQGHDPEVRMKFVATFIGMSVSNLYKKIEAGTFPSSIKRGRSSFWKVSTLRAYQEGTWPPVAVQP